MKKIVFGSTLMLLFVVLTSLVPAEKFKYTSEEGKVSVIFPGEFATTIKNDDSFKTVKTQAMFNDVVFFVSYTIHEEKLEDGPELSKVSLDSFIEALNATDVQESPWHVRKKEGLQATFKVAENNLKGDYRVVLIGQTQYQITAVGSEQNWDQKVIDKFMKSFKVKN